MRILVTGGCGFIGSHVVELLLKRGHEVLVIDDLSTGRRGNLPADVTVRSFSVIFRAPIRIYFEEFRPQAVLHLAAQASISNSLRDPNYDMEVNGIGTLNLLQSCVEFGVNTFVLASTSAVYADSKKELKETSALAEGGSPYGISKAAAEQYTRVYMPSAVILRLGNVYGPRQVPIGENQLIARMIQHLKYDEPFYIFGDGEQERDFVYVEDVAKAFVAGMNGKGGTYNISWSSSTSVNDAAQMMGDLYGFPHYEWKHDLTRPDKRRRVWMDTTLAGKELRWQAETRLMDGMQKTMEWWDRGEE